MGYLYRPMLKGKEDGYEPTPQDLGLSRGARGNGQEASDGERCHHPDHGKADFCRGCLARFGKTWWVKYYVNGKAIRESTETEKETEARRFLKAKEGRAAIGQPILPRMDRVTYDDMAAALRQHYQTTGRRKLTEVEDRLAHLDAFFTGWRAVNIDGGVLADYVAKRQGEPTSRGDRPANRTINIELALLRRMFRLASENGTPLPVPPISKKMLKDAAPRKGFFERELYEAVRRYLPPDLQVAVAVAHTFGWRIRSEVLTLELRQVDLEAGTIQLDPGQMKNDEARVVYLTPELRALLAAQKDRVMDLMRERSAVIPYLFPHLAQGQRRQDFVKAWKTACRKAGCPGRLKHDFRRTAVRNMVNASIPERVAMEMTGHETRSVFDRYHIVSPADLQEAARKLAGTFAGTFGQKALDAATVSVRQ
ncbi:MAG: tyrosine-type recombinase/integrase [Candidatus Methylomirabilales bacterium]